MIEYPISREIHKRFSTKHQDLPLFTIGIQNKMVTSVTALNMIKLLRGSVVTQTMLGGLTLLY